VMVTKRAFARKRAMASNNINEIKAIETMTTITMTTAKNTTMTMTMLAMMTKTTMKKTTTMVPWRRLALAGGSGGGQQRRQWRGVSVHIVLSKLNSGCCWLLARGR
jgi:hypothetical protein